MSNLLRSVAAPLMIIALGVGWLLTTQGIMPGVNWIWVLGLAIAGVLILAAGVDKVSIVLGPFLLAATFFSLLRQTDRLSPDVEIPLLVITFGALFLAARLLPVPIPRWLTETVQKGP